MDSVLSKQIEEADLLKVGDNLNEPRQIVKGVTAKWTESFADYPASESWVVTYYFRGIGQGIDVVGVADGDDFDFTISASASAALSSGDYKYQAVAVLSGEKFIVSEGIINVKDSFIGSSVSTTIETRSGNKIILDKIDSMICGSLDKNVQEYTIDNRQLKRYTPTELLMLRDKYARLVAQEVENSSENSSSPFLRPRKFRHWKAS